MGDRIGVLNQGRLVQVGTPHEIYNNPRQHLRRALRRLAADEPASTGSWSAATRSWRDEWRFELPGAAVRPRGGR